MVDVPLAALMGGLDRPGPRLAGGRRQRDHARDALDGQRAAVSRTGRAQPLDVDARPVDTACDVQGPADMRDRLDGDARVDRQLPDVVHAGHLGVILVHDPEGPDGQLGDRRALDAHKPEPE